MNAASLVPECKGPGAPIFVGIVGPPGPGAPSIFFWTVELGFHAADTLAGRDRPP